MARPKFNLDAVSEKLDNAIVVLQKLTSIGEMVPNLFLQGGIAYAGYRAADDNIGGSIFGLLGLKLAQAQNLPASIAGVGMLGMLGLASLPRDENLQALDNFKKSPTVPEVIKTGSTRPYGTGGGFGW